MSEADGGSPKLRELLVKGREAHPFPWSRVVYPNGRIVIVDAKGGEVSLLLLTELVCELTSALPVVAKSQPQQ